MKIYFQFTATTKKWNRKFLVAFVVMIVQLGYSEWGYSQTRTFKAGAAVVDITPPLGSGIVGNFVVPPATHIHDELKARVLVLDNGQSKLVWVVADNVGIHREVFDESKRIILKETGISPGQVMMSSTHTHSGVSAGGEGDKRWGFNVDKPLDEYQTFIAKRMADGVQVALNNLEPARIGWGAGTLPDQVFNRRWIMKEKVVNPFGDLDQVQFNPGINNPNRKEPAGPTDPQVSVVSVKSLEGREIALLANYSLHYVGGVPKGHISSDYFGVFADKIQSMLKADRQEPPFVAILSNGTSGDVNNVNTNVVPKPKAAYEKMKEVAQDLATEVLRVHKGIQYQNWVELKSADSELKLRVRKPTEKQVERARMVVKRPADVKPGHSLEVAFAHRIIQLHNEWPDQIDVVMQAFRVGDLGIAAIPFEVFAETGLEIKAKSPFKSSFTIELANGCYIYLPTPAQHKLGGYETWLSIAMVEENASVAIVDEILKLFNKVK